MHHLKKIQTLSNGTGAPSTCYSVSTLDCFLNPVEELVLRHHLPDVFTAVEPKATAPEQIFNAVSLLVKEKYPSLLTGKQKTKRKVA